MAFGDHLRADQNVDLAVAESAEHTLEVANVPHRVAVDSADARVRVERLQLGLKPLRSLAYVVDVLAVAFRTSRRRTTGKTTIVAKQLVDARDDRSAQRCRKCTER